MTLTGYIGPWGRPLIAVTREVGANRRPAEAENRFYLIQSSLIESKFRECRGCRPSSSACMSKSSYFNVLDRSCFVLRNLLIVLECLLAVKNIVVHLRLFKTTIAPQCQGFALCSPLAVSGKRVLICC